MSAEIVQFIPRPNPSRFAQSCREARGEQAELVPFAKSGGPSPHYPEAGMCGFVAPDDDCA